MTPLHHAISNSKYSTAKILLDHGADPRLVSRAGLSPLHLAIDKEFDVSTQKEPRQSNGCIETYKYLSMRVRKT